MALSSRMSYTSTSSHACIVKMLASRYHEIDNPDGFVNLAVAENSLMHDELSAHIKDNVDFDSCTFSYGNGGSGSERLRTATARFCNRRFHPAQPLTSTSLLCTSGMTNAIESLAFALADKDDAFLLARPYYGSFPHILRDRPGCQTVSVKFNGINPFGIEAIMAYRSALAEAQADGIVVRGIILCNPHNPLGHCYDKAMLEALLRFAGEHSLHIISDEIYALTSWSAPGATAFTSILSLNCDTLIDPALVHCLWGVSKDFGASGFRLASIVSPHNRLLLDTLATRGLYTFPSGPVDSMVSQILEDDRFCDSFLHRSSEKLYEAHQLVTSFLDKHNISYNSPGGAAIFVWADLGSKLAALQREAAGCGNTEDQSLTRIDSSHELLDVDIAARLVDHKVYLASGIAFGSEKPGWFRIVFSHPGKYVELGLTRMIEALQGEASSVELSLPAMICSLCR